MPLSLWLGAALLSLYLLHRWLPWRLWRWLVFALLCWPFADLSLIHRLASVLGPLALTTQLWLALWLVQRWRGRRWAPTPTSTLVLVAAVGLVLYLSHLGLTPWLQLYPAGLTPQLFSFGLIAAAAWLLASDRHSAWLLLAALALWLLGGHVSANLWDALLDPVLVIAALGGALKRWVRRFFSKAWSKKD